MFPEESVEPSLLRESGRDLPAAFGATSRVVSMSSTEMIWWPPQRQAARGADFPELRAPADYFAFVLWFPHLRFVHRIYNRTDLSVVPPLADGPNPVN